MAKDNLYLANISTIVPALGLISATDSSPMNQSGIGGLGWW